MAGIAAAMARGATFPLLDGATRAFQVLAGARLPDLLEPARTPHHRAFWHSKALGAGLALLACLLAQGSVWGDATPRAFFKRVGALFLIAGYLGHLALDLLTKRGLS